jgi:hypothetical protein
MFMSNLKLKFVVHCLQPKLLLVLLFHDLHLLVTLLQLHFMPFLQQLQFVRMLLLMQVYQISVIPPDVYAKLLKALHLLLQVVVVPLHNDVVPLHVDVVPLQVVVVPPQKVQLLLQQLLSADWLRHLLIFLVHQPAILPISP